jgi:hypothetical protein
MTKTQKIIVFNWLLAVLLLILFPVFEGWILDHWKTLKWPAFAALVIFVALSKNTSISTRAEGRFEFNRIADEHPWIKIYWVTYGIVIAIGDYYAISHQIDLVNDVGVFSLAGPILLLLLPIVIIKQREAWNEAGL